MTYQETLDWMFNQLPMYQRQGQKAYKVDLTNTLLLAKHLNHPETQFKSIHVAGTNGKGSTSHMLASTLQEAGYKVGLYTSPHLKDFRERIKINREMIPEENVIQFIENNKDFFKKEALSFFEMTVGLAFEYFANEKVDIAVIETGLGGRLDSTNIIKPEISIITNIGFDHMALLGDTLDKIAFEKAGIIKEKTPVIIGERNPLTEPVFIKKAQQMEAPIYFAEDYPQAPYETELKGSYQIKNKQTATIALRELAQLGWKLTEENIKNGLEKVIQNTGLLGRWQTLSTHPKIICDTGHNREGLTYVLKQLQEEEFDQLHIVMGVVNDKDLSSVLPLFPKNARYYFCKPDVPRGLSAELLQSEAASYQLMGDTYPSVNQALDFAKSQANQNDLIFIGGSTFTVAEII